MFLPQIKSIGLQHSQEKERQKTINHQKSFKNISSSLNALKQRCHTEDKQYIGKKLLNFMSFDRVKSLKSYTQICQDNLRRFQEEKSQLQQILNRQSVQAQLKKKTVLSPMSSSIKIHLKTQKTAEIISGKRNNIFELQARIKTQVSKKEDCIKAGLKEEMKVLQHGDVTKMKRYSQMSIRDIVEKDLLQKVQKMKPLNAYKRKRSQRIDGW